MLFYNCSEFTYSTVTSCKCEVYVIVIVKRHCQEEQIK